MHRSTLTNLVVRLLILGGGFGALYGFVYAAGLWIVPLVDGVDKAILAAINPDSYLPVFDEFIRALTDYTNLVLGFSIIAWMVAYGLYRLLPKYKSVFTGLLAITAIVMTVLAAIGKLWPNSTLLGANIIEVLAFLIALSAATYAFHRMNHDQLRRFGRLFWLLLLSVYLADIRATNPIKDSIARPRPFNEANRPWNEAVRPIPDELLRGANSFPSGHTSGTFSLLTPIFWYVRKPKARAGLLSWCVLQGFSRVYTGAHFPFCVLMGGLLGFGVGTLVFFTLGGPSLRGRETGSEEVAPNPA